ncbi:sodium:calcium antiporter [Ramlibacter sp. AW1]|uniref:Sodium:calcium antiporter n=1 Tax=Ramlibacter aurantiacus TaxID=2801330 RepID=A0A936ZIG5_9BURK|nr:sodium:calcium antiporter [Ramlibacter aurantiacus]MBL0421512.1 sodium:calcium antiporter [Ramlibacter aurantiacus]
MFEELPLWVNLLLFAASAAAVWLSAVQLTRAVEAIAARTGMGQEIAGVLLLGGVTSLPELAVAVTATTRGSPALTINDLLGSAAINVLLLVFADALIRGRALTSVQGSPKVLLIGVLGVIVMAIVVAPTVTGDTLLWGMGRWSWVSLVVFAGAIWFMGNSQAPRGWSPLDHGQPLRKTQREDEGSRDGRLRSRVMRAIASGAGVLVSGFVLASTGEAVAEGTGLGTSFFGVVVLAFATSLPEASTVFTAVRMKRYEMAMSDVLGTNIFNVTIIALVDALHDGEPVLLETGRFASFSALLALVLTGLFLIGLIERRDRTVGRLGVDSILALIAYTGGLFVLYALR